MPLGNGCSFSLSVSLALRLCRSTLLFLGETGRDSSGMSVVMPVACLYRYSPFSEPQSPNRVCRLQLNPSLTTQTPQVQDSVPQDCPPAQTPGPNPRWSPALLTDQPEVQGFPPTSHSILCSQAAHRTQESVFLPFTGLFIKDKSQEQPNGRDAFGCS